jgi:hypothetical protein
MGDGMAVLPRGKETGNGRHGASWGQGVCRRKNFFADAGAHEGPEAWRSQE